MIQTDIDYPKGLPPSLISRGPDAPVSALARTPMATGRARQRRKFTSAPVIAPFSLLLDSGEAMLFELWYAETLKDGVEWFNMPRRLPTGYVNLVCRFVEIYQGPAPVSFGRWAYTFQLEYFERSLLPKEWLVAPDFIRLASIFDIAMNREWPEA